MTNSYTVHVRTLWSICIAQNIQYNIHGLDSVIMTHALVLIPSVKPLPLCWSDPSSINSKFWNRLAYRPNNIRAAQTPLSGRGTKPPYKGGKAILSWVSLRSVNSGREWLPHATLTAKNQYIKSAGNERERSEHEVLQYVSGTSI